VKHQNNNKQKIHEYTSSLKNVLSSSKLELSEVASSTSEHSLRAILPWFYNTHAHTLLGCQAKIVIIL